MKRLILSFLMLSLSLLLMGTPFAFAATVDLTTAGALVTAADGSIWSVINNRPTGTGVYEPFLRLQNDGTEAGLNTDGDKNTTYNDVAGIWTHSLTFGQLGTVTVGGVNYYSFSFDINEPAGGNNEFLSLDVLSIYKATSGILTDTASLGTALYNFNDAPVLASYLLSSSGSGNDDIEVLIPKTFFTSVLSTDFLYMYVEFGGLGTSTLGSPAGSKDYGSADGFEEVHAFLGPQQQVPEPGTLLLLGGGLVGLAFYGRKAFKR